MCRAPFATYMLMSLGDWILEDQRTQHQRVPDNLLAYHKWVEECDTESKEQVSKNWSYLVLDKVVAKLNGIYVYTDGYRLQGSTRLSQICKKNWKWLPVHNIVFLAEVPIVD